MVSLRVLHLCVRGFLKFHGCQRIVTGIFQMWYICLTKQKAYKLHRIAMLKHKKHIKHSVPNILNWLLEKLLQYFL